MRADAHVYQRSDAVAVEGVLDGVQAFVASRGATADRPAPRPSAAAAILPVVIQRGWYPPLKLVVEWGAAVVLVVLTAPLVLLLAVLVKATSSGPAFYKQRRLGLNGRVYWMYKLRSMTHNCEARTGPVWAAKNDVRITGVGRFLRETHLDELPQLLNVLKFDMALVGPRPERPEIAGQLEKALPMYMERLNVRPGVTGLAQMRLPADSDLEGVRRKLAHDLYYVREVSPTLDVRVVLSTSFYFLGAIANALCAFLVLKDGKVVEEEFEPYTTLVEECSGQAVPVAAS